MTAGGSTRTTQAEQLLARNLAALRKTDPWLAERIEACPEPPVALEPSRAGPPTTAVATPDGHRVYLHSRYDPIAEARTFADRIDPDEAFCFVVGGFGLGYHVRALLDRLKGDAFLIVTEPSLALLRAGLGCVDLADALAGHRCVILTNDDKARLHDRLDRFIPLMMMGLQFVPHAACQRAARAFHDAMRATLTDYVAYGRMTLVTLLANARITCTNIAYNLPTYLATPPIDILRDRFRGYPAVVISAGPSLARNVHLLAGLRGRAILCAVQTVFKPLLNQGITPDFVTSLDFHEISRRFFEGVQDCRDVHLIAEPKVTWHVIDTYRGPISMLANEFAALCLGEELARRDGLRSGATVAHLAFYLAEYMGCDPIIFVGQDLAFSENVYYTPGVELHESWRSELNRFYSIETKEWERIARRRRVLRKVRDIHGDEIYTDEPMFAYLQQFERDFAQTSARVIDASEAGARKAGAEVMALGEAIERYCTRPIPPERFAYRRQVRWFDASRLAAGRDALQARLEEARAFRALCQEAIPLLEQMQDLLDVPAEFNRRFARINELRRAVDRHGRILRMVSCVTQIGEFRRFTADRKIAAQGPTGRERARRQLARDIEFLRSLSEGADALIEILSESIRRFDRIIARHAGGT